MRCADGEEPLAGIGTTLGQPTQNAPRVLATAHASVRAIRREAVAAVVT